MYPQSLQTHSPCQYCAALASSSAFCAAVFFFPNTMFKLVVELSTLLETEVVEDNLGTVKALAESSTLKSAMMANTNLMKDFMIGLVFDNNVVQ